MNDGLRRCYDVDVQRVDVDRRVAASPERLRRRGVGPANGWARRWGALIFARCLVFLAALLAPVLAGATELGNVATTMAVGTWAQVGTINPTIINDWIKTTDPNISRGWAYDDNVLHWNSKKRQLYFVTCTDPGTIAQLPSPLFGFTDDTNTWTQIGPRPSSTETCYHGYDNLAWDDANEVLYFSRPYYYTGEVYRYCVNNTPSWCSGKAGTWSLIASANGRFPNDPILTVGLTYHAAYNGGTLLMYYGSAYGDGCGGLMGYSEMTQTWTVIRGAGCTLPVPTTAGLHVMAEYSAVKKVAIFGGGNGNAKVWKMDAAGTITQLASAPAPIMLGASNRSLVADPISGNFIVIGGATGSPNGMYELNPDVGGAWTLLDSDLTTSGKICAQKYDASLACSADFFGASISTYGVIGYWKLVGPSSAEFWLYKHKAPTPPTPPTSLTVK